MTIVTVFLHHDVDSTTREHWRRCCKFAPGPVVTISATDKRLPKGTSILDWPSEARIMANHLARNPDLKARSTDLMLLAWFRNREISGDSYFIVEWDTLINCSIEDWLQPVLKYPFSAPTVRFMNREPEWFWFPHLITLPREIQPFSCGVVPFTCLHLSHRSLLEINSAYPEDPGTGNGELRFASVAASRGIPPVPNPAAGKTITWQPIEPVGLAPTIYHAIKSDVPTPKPWMQEAEIAALECLLHPDFHVLEYGAGASTFWLSERVRQVTTIEYNPNWVEQLRPVPANVNLIYEPPAWPGPPFGPAEPGQFDRYVQAGNVCTPDLVLVDGRARVACATMWAHRAITLLHDANRDRYASLSLQQLAGSLAVVKPQESDSPVSAFA